MSDIPERHPHPLLTLPGNLALARAKAGRRGPILALFLTLNFCLPARAADPAQTVAPPGQTPPAPPPLLVDEDEPLLLEEPSTNALAATASQAAHGQGINAACYVCHVNFKQDPFVQWHASTNIGCVKCHGESRAHVADEANLTPPDIIYWPSRVGFSCYWCHQTHDVPPREVLARFQERCANLPDPKKVVCTDCHGHHRLPIRTIVWNKRTRELISKTGLTNLSAAPRPPATGNRPPDPPVADLANQAPEQGSTP